LDLPSLPPRLYFSPPFLQADLRHQFNLSCLTVFAHLSAVRNTQASNLHAPSPLRFLPTPTTSLALYSRPPCFIPFPSIFSSLSHVFHLPLSEPQASTLRYIHDETKRLDRRLSSNTLLRGRLLQQRLSSQQSLQTLNIHHGLSFPRFHVHLTYSLQQETLDVPTSLRQSLVSLLSRPLVWVEGRDPEAGGQEGRLADEG